ncbi:hypothetical protein BK025_00650 [Sodalis sp. TME1]|nr:hypothetical protein BK025_00650 [Sodalis sp. TME1]
MTIKAESPFIAWPPAGARLLFVAQDPATSVHNLIPGSLPTAIASHFAGEGGGGRGRLPLPPREAVQAWLAQAGIDEHTAIVVYDGGNGSQAARAWWVLNWAGYRRVSILAGGLNGWQAQAAQPQQQAAITPSAGAFHEVTTEEIARRPHDFLLVDARNHAAFAGDGLVPSHLPAAINLPMAALQDEQGRLVAL